MTHLNIADNQLPNVAIRENYPGRIMILVPHEPDEDPRVRWVSDLCRPICRTDVLGFTWLVTAKPSREYDGQIFTERIFPTGTNSGVGILFRLICNPAQTLLVSRKLRRLLRVLHIERTVLPILELIDSPRKTLLVSRKFRRLLRVMHIEGTVLPILEPRLASSTQGDEKQLSNSKGKPHQSSLWTAMITALRCQRQSILDLIDILRGIRLNSTTLFQRARAVSIVPRVVICHDLHALLAGVKLKKLKGCPVIYDSHEFWPQAFLQAGKLEQRVIEMIERR